MSAHDAHPLQAPARLEPGDGGVTLFGGRPNFRSRRRKGHAVPKQARRGDNSQFYGSACVARRNRDTDNSVMDALGQLNAEFENLGEAAVAERLNANYYRGSARAVAMRWLNEQSLARVGIDAPAHGTRPYQGSARMAPAEQTAQAAVLCAVAALLAAIGSMGLSFQTLQAVHSLRQSVAQMSQPATPPPR
jgi:hypothetical protein